VLNTRLVLVTGLVLGLAACATPAPLDNLSDELARHQQALPPDLAGRPLTVDDAVRLAVAHNLDLRVKVMEAELATGKAELSRFAMLPQMSLSSAATVRSRVRETTSRDATTGTDGTNYSTSEDKRNVTADLSLSWNLVDLGLAVLRSGEEDDRVIIADEKRRRALHLLVQDVRVAYWKAVVNETSERRYRALEGRLNEAIGKARAAESEQVSDPMQLLNHQRAIIDSMRQIAEMQRQSATARSELAGLMGVASVANFQLTQLPEEADLPVTVPGDDVDALEREALASRPEVQVDESQFRIDVDEVRAEMLKTIPGIGPFLGGHYDSTSFVRNNAWADAGLRVAWSLSDLISAPRRIDNARAAAEVTRARRMASAMAVMTQVNVADNLYRHAFREYQLTRQMAEVDGRIRRLSGDARKAGNGSEIEEMKAQAASALSSLRRLLIYADLEGAKAKLDAALGRDPLKPEPPAAKPDLELPPVASLAEDAPAAAPQPVAQPSDPQPSAPQPSDPQPSAPQPSDPQLAPQSVAAPAGTMIETAAEMEPSPPDKGRLVYLASFRTAAGAQRGWDQMQRLAPALTGQPVLRPVDLGHKGRFIRVFAAAQDDVHADRICRELAASSAECGITGRE
jgi:outer membrane protein TolC